MPQRDKVSIGGPFGLQAEGPFAISIVAGLIGAGLLAAFYLGKLSALFESCFGLRFN